MPECPRCGAATAPMLQWLWLDGGLPKAVYAAAARVRLRRLFLAVPGCMLVCYGTLAASSIAQAHDIGSDSGFLAFRHSFHV